MIRRLLQLARRVLRALDRRRALLTGAAPVEDQLRLVNEQGHPNVNALWQVTKDIEALRLNVKMLGYSLACSLEGRLQAIPVEPQKGFVLDSKPCTQADIESRWFRYWCEQLKERPRFHRKLWEYAYVLQGLNAGGAFEPGARVLGLGDANQPIPSYLARMGAQVTIALDPASPVPGKGAVDPLYRDFLVDRPVFARLVERKAADLNALPETFRGYDAAWSIETVTRRGSIDRGLQLVRGAMAALKPGGLAVHILDFNFADDSQTIDDWGSVLFQRRHIEALAAALKADGHAPSPLDFNAGFQEMDRFIDLPPYDTARTPSFDRMWRDGWQAAHLKAMVDGFACTSFGLVVHKARA